MKASKYVFYKRGKNEVVFGKKIQVAGRKRYLSEL
jgi:hypothetical protein